MRSGAKSEVSAKGPLDALLASDLSFSSLDEDNSADPARYEALINGQLHRDNFILSGGDVSISAWGGTDCLAGNCVAPSASLDLSTHLANSTPLGLPWLYRQNDHITTMKVDSFIMYFLWVCKRHTWRTIWPWICAAIFFVRYLERLLAMLL